MRPPEEDPDREDIATLRTYLSQNGVRNDWEIMTKLLGQCRYHSPSCSVEQIIWEIEAELPTARQARNPMAWLVKVVPKRFVGGSFIPISPAGCPMPRCIERQMTALNQAGECVNCGLTREIAQQAANDPAIKAALAMGGSL
jgi:hypothetical protein